LAGGYALMLPGSGLLAGGLLADLEYEASYGESLWIGGLIVMVSGGVSMFKPGKLEGMAEQFGDGRSPDELRSVWQDEAKATKRARQIGGGVLLGLGVVAGTAGSLVAAGVGDADEQPKRDWSVALLLASGGLFAGGVASLLVESPIEEGYRAAYGESAEGPPVTVGIAPAPGGGTVSLLGRF
jgi:hypothetical protein